MKSSTQKKAIILEPSSKLRQYVDELEREAIQLELEEPYPQWVSALLDSEHSKAITLIDSILAEQPNNVLARLVWIRAHLGARQLPTTALCAPLEEVAEIGQSTEGNFAKLTKALFMQAAFALESSEQSRLSWSMMHRALEMKLEDTPDALHIETLNFAVELLDREILRAQQKRESNNYINGLLNSKSTLQKDLNSIKTPSKLSQSPETQLKPTSLSVSAKDIAENAPIPEPNSSETTPVSEKRISPTLLALSVSITLLGGYFYLFTPKPPAAKPKASIQLALSSKANLIPPKLEISKNAPLDSKLESVGRRLEELGSSDIKQEPTSDDEIDSQALNLENAKHLDSPITPENDLLVSLDGESPGAGNIPSYDASKISSNVAGSLESIGENKRGNPIPPAALGQKLKVDPKGRVFGPASSRDQANRNGQRVALDGSPLKSYEVEQFSPPKLFRTIIATRVLSAPSILSTTLAELPENTPIHVSARMGRWLELRSTGGRVGYIFSQDATVSK